MFKILIQLVCFAIAGIHAAAASDLKKERRWSQQIVDSLLVGEAVELNAAGSATRPWCCSVTVLAQRWPPAATLAKEDTLNRRVYAWLKTNFE